MAVVQYAFPQCLAILFLAKLVLTQNFQLVPLAITTETVTLACHNSADVAQDINDVQFWLNRSRTDVQDLRDRGDIAVIEDEMSNDISFTLSRSIEGYYTCGRQIDSVNFDESSPLILIGKYDSHV